MTSFIPLKISGIILSAPRVLKFNPSGVFISDTIYNHYLTVDSLSFFDGGRTLVNNNDSSMYFFYTYQDNSINGNTGEIGVLLAKYEQNGNFLWEKRLAHPSNLQDKPNYVVRGFSFISDTTFLVSLMELKAYASMQLEYQNNAKVTFL